MSRSLPVAVIGCGHLGTFHARLYHAMPEAELRVVMDIVPERARALGESLGVPWTADREEAIARAEAVSVATPTVTHAEVAGACLNAGRAVLVEKPLAATIEEGEELVRLATAKGRVLAVGHIERFNPAFRAVRAAVRSPRFIESHRLSTFVPRSLDVDVVLDLMIHDLDLTLGLVPAPIESIDAIGVPVLTAGEDIANARIRFTDGAVANLTASRVSREKVRKIRFFASRRYISIDLMEQKVEQVILERMEEGEPPADASASPTIPSTSSGGAPPSSSTTAASAPAPARASAEEAALLAFLGARRLRLRHGAVEVPRSNALEEELRDFLAAMEGNALEGASGEQGLRNLRAALEIHARVQQSLRRLGSEEIPPAS
jgi:predicted dehydrogenase